MPTDVLTWAATIKDGALATALIILLYGGAKRWWCFGYQLTREEQRVIETKTECEARLAAAQRREDEWKELALTGGHLASEAMGLVRERKRP